MIYDWIIDDNFTTLVKNVAIWFVAVILVILLIFIDLHYGVTKSKKNGDYEHSYGLSKTAKKLKDRLAIMLIALVFDALNPVFYYTELFPLPLISIGFAVFLVRIDYISVLEHLEVGERKKIREQPKEILDALREIKDIADEIKNITK